MTLTAISGAAQMLYQPLNSDDQNQQRRLQERPESQQNTQQTQQNAMNTTQANAQEAIQRPQAAQENQMAGNEQPTNYAQTATSDATRGSLIDLLV